jgi:hypothetical protein
MLITNRFSRPNSVTWQTPDFVYAPASQSNDNRHDETQQADDEAAEEGDLMELISFFSGSPRSLFTGMIVDLGKSSKGDINARSSTKNQPRRVTAF